MIISNRDITLSLKGEVLKVGFNNTIGYTGYRSDWSLMQMLERERYMKEVEERLNLPRCEDAKEHMDILNGLHDMYVKKNIAYGNSTTVTYEEFGLVSYVVRLYDKMNRLKSIIKSPDVEKLIHDERTEDTLLDMANYCVMAVIDLRRKNEK